MGWFNDQIKSRIEYDNTRVENSFYDLSSVIMGKSKISAAVNNERIKTKNAIEEICRYYRAEISDIPDNIQEMNEQIEYLLRPSGIMRRNVKLDDKWWKKSVGPLLCETKSGDVVALMPLPAGGYRFFDYSRNKTVRVNTETAKQLEEDAICFYRPFPREPVRLSGLIRFLLQSLSRSDGITVCLAALAVTLLGLFTPTAANMIFSGIIPSGEKVLLVSIAFLLVGIAVSTFLISVAKSLIQSKIQTKLDVALQSAMMGRIVNLPTSFFKGYSAGELAGRAQSVNTLCAMLCDAVLTGGLTTVFSLAYIAQIAVIARPLALPALFIMLFQLLVLCLGVVMNFKLVRRQMQAGAKVNGIVFSLYAGIQKIKLGGSEKRAFAKWARLYRDEAENKFNPPFFLKIQNALTPVIALAGTLMIYYTAAVSGVTPSQYMAFNAASGMVSGAVFSLSGMVNVFSFIGPIFEMVEPVLSQLPEVSENKRVAQSLSGTIELNNVSFCYHEGGPLILDNLSLKIRRGQYIAVVGKTGCGKSTLMRLLLGFEKPQKGAVYYDGVDMEKIDLQSLRRNIGVVMQNGKLFAGDIYSNITISAPWLTLDDAWKAAEMTGIAEDIRNMPMGMHTIISEGAGGISGGQRQRLMIARAIAPDRKYSCLTRRLQHLTI